MQAPDRASAAHASLLRTKKLSGGDGARRRGSSCVALVMWTILHGWTIWSLCIFDRVWVRKLTMYMYIRLLFHTEMIHRIIALTKDGDQILRYTFLAQKQVDDTGTKSLGANAVRVPAKPKTKHFQDDRQKISRTTSSRSHWRKPWRVKWIPVVIPDVQLYILPIVYIVNIGCSNGSLEGLCTEQRLEDKQHDMKTYTHNSCHRACWHRATRLPPARVCVSTFLCSAIIYLLLYSHRHVAPLIRGYGRGCGVRGVTIES